jgi:hypothetical protein
MAGWLEERGKNKWRLNVPGGTGPDGQRRTYRRVVEATSRREAKKLLALFFAEIELSKSTPIEPPKPQARRHIPGELREMVYKRDNYRCRYCGEQVIRATATIDHVIPYSKGGKTELNNLVTACDECNLIKHDLTSEEAGMPLLPINKTAIEKRSGLLLLKEAARYLRINKQSVLRLLLKSEFNYLVSGNEIFIDTKELDIWLAKAEERPMHVLFTKQGGD